MAHKSLPQNRAPKGAGKANKTAQEGTQTRESQGASESMVHAPAKPLQGPPYWPEYSPNLVSVALADMRLYTAEESQVLVHLDGLFRKDKQFRSERDTLLQNLKEATGASETHFYVRLFAARVFRSAFLVGYYSGRATCRPAAAEGGAL